MKTKVTILVACIVLAIAHNIWPSVKIDLATMALVVVAIRALPWLAGVIRSIEIPGGFKIELNDVKAATEKVAAGRVAKATSSGMATDRVDRALLSEVGERDPNLALVGLRIEIERRLSRLASAIGISSNRRSAGFLLRDLVSREAVDPETAAGLADLIALGNQAAHGADVSRSAASWAIESGPLVLGVLDTLIAESPANPG